MSAFFRNATIYRLARPWAITAEELGQALGKFAFEPTGDLVRESCGWVPPHVSCGDDLVFAAQGHFLLSLRIESKVMPGKAVELAVRERAAELEDEQGYKPGRRQLKEIKERVIDDMLPRAFRQQREIRVWMDPQAGIMAIDAGTPSQCDIVVGMLAKALDPFPVSSLHVHASPAQAMTQWLAQDMAPNGFTVDTDAELRATGDASATVRYQRQPLDANDVLKHIRAGKQCTLLALTWMDRVSFVLTENLVLKRICALDVLTQQADRVSQTDADRFAADFVLMAGELRGLLADLIHAHGGEKLDLAQAAEAAENAASPEVELHDVLFHDACSVVSTERRASISLIQRHLRIGYNRAARLLEQMEQAGIVSAMSPAGAREVLIA
ncbi:recombination-associated protein RdgC [Bordetella sp. BOR01]|uniref:recombination-associated protein RdgC n=1 Tax=Bordetella sp. BOR01 TaxID=2854779 RepID=UPI001C440064|nr:recombination-associated protein RdgC [Bordetella sp. BOR01]MBV7482486.1 recombination-associated protein RdgC [Bordetella sp. BOR01]